MTRWKWIKRLFAVTGGLFIASLISGLVWPLQIHYLTTGDASGPMPAETNGAQPPFVGLALSGGGARAALFGAAGMEALASRGLLKDVSHVSSVSGGGFPASYLATHAMPDCAAKGFPAVCRNAYFKNMKNAIGRDFFWDLTKTQVLTPWRVMRPSSRLSSLQEALDKAYLGGGGFKDISDSRAYYFNTVSYDTGQRYVLSNRPLPHPDFEGGGPLPANVRALSFSTPSALRTTPSDFPIALAVATSAAFPPYLGPMTLQIGETGKEDTRYRHLGDGGILENSGVETLREAAVATDGLTKGLIYSFNAGQSLDKDTSQKESDLSIFSTDITQFVDVLLEYAGGQREAFFAQFEQDLGLDIEVIKFDYLDVENIVDQASSDFRGWRSWAPWSAKCSASVRANSPSPAQHLKKIPTSLRITKCDSALIQKAAVFLVQHCLRETPALGCFSARAE